MHERPQRSILRRGPPRQRGAAAGTELFPPLPDDRLGSASHGFYGEEGLERARRHLAPGGVLGVWSYAESSDFSRALRSGFGRIRVEPVTYFNALVDEERTDWLFFARD